MKKTLILAIVGVFLGMTSTISATSYLYTDRNVIYRLDSATTYCGYIVFMSTVWDGGAYAGRGLVFYNPNDQALKIIAFSHSANYYKAHNIECHWSGDGTYAKGFRNEDSGSFSQFDVLLFYGSTSGGSAEDMLNVISAVSKGDAP